MIDEGIDYLAFTGHKDLQALPGVGGLCSLAPLTFAPLIQGGTGIRGDNYVNPDVYPDSYEAGTINMPAIWSLKTAIDFIEQRKEEIISIENELLNYLTNQIKLLDNIILYNIDRKRCATICFNVKGCSSSEVVKYLDQRGICVRGGIHCAILAHEKLNTVTTGAVRCSMNYNNTKEEIDQLIAALKEMA